VTDDLRFRIAALRTALCQLNVSSAAIWACSADVVTESREILAKVALRRVSERGQQAAKKGIPGQRLATPDEA
jgi:hypothetical protein